MISHLNNLAVAATLPTASMQTDPIDRESLMERFDQEILCLVPQEHFFPKEAIRASFLPKKYDAQDLQKIWEDFWFLKEQTFANAEKSTEYIATAGGPSAGKSTILEEHLSSNPNKFAYIDPDRSCLQKMPNSYLADLENNRRDVAGAYDHWREASNLLANVFLAYAIDQGYAIAHGTTMTSPHIATMLSFLKNHDYTRVLQHVNCPDDVRLSTEEIRRQGGIFQCTDEDLINKGVDFHKRLGDYLANSDKVIFYYRPSIETTIVAATKDSDGLKVENPGAFEKIANLYNEAIEGGNFEKQVTLAR